MRRVIDPLTFKKSYLEDEARLVQLGFFVRGEPYRLWGLLPSDRHFFGVKATAGKAKAGKLARLLSGSLKLPARVTAAEACTSGSVTVSVERGGKTVLPPTQVSLHRDCSWRLRFTATSGNAKFLATAKFGGNAVLKPASTGRRFH